MTNQTGLSGELRPQHRAPFSTMMSRKKCSIINTEALYSLPVGYVARIEAKKIETNHGEIVGANKICRGIRGIVIVAADTVKMSDLSCT
jgi:hypothetical protein